jgi:hypothetical protein
MTTTIRSYFTLCLAVAALFAMVLSTSSAQAGTIDHGDFVGLTVTFNGVTESSTTDGVPLYGTPVTIGDTLSFFQPGVQPDPSLGFGASATGGPSDLTDGFLSFNLMAKPGNGITNLDISEAGDYSLDSVGGALAKVTANLIIAEVTITHVDGSPIAPVVVANDLRTVSFEIPADPQVGIFNLLSPFDIAQMLDDASVPFNLGATKITVKLNNTLSAIALPGATANIVKKSFDIDVTTQVPEPSTALLGFMAFSGLGLIAARRHG